MTLFKLVKLSTGYPHALKVGQVFPYVRALRGWAVCLGGWVGIYINLIHF